MLKSAKIWIFSDFSITKNFIENKKNLGGDYKSIVEQSSGFWATGQGAL